MASQRLPQRWLHRAGATLVVIAGMAGLVGLAGLGGCRAKPPRASASVPGPQENAASVVLITVSSLRFDATELGTKVSSPLPTPVQATSWTPRLDALAVEALDRGGWAGAALASSSETVPSAAALLTGLLPHQHRVLRRGDSLPQAALTLAEYFRAAGLRTTAYVDKGQLDATAGFDQGFENFRPLRRAQAAAGHLSSLGAEPEFLWLHLQDIDWPYLRHPDTAARLGIEGNNLPQRLTLRRLEAFFDPSRDIPPGFVNTIRRLYAGEVAHADQRLGRLLESFSAAPGADQAWLVVAGLHGTDLGEEGRIGNGSGLTRAALTTPLVIVPPKGASLRWSIAPNDVVELRRVFASLLETNELAVPVAVSPSFFGESARPAGPILAELYAVGGSNEFSLVDGDLRWLRRARFSTSVRDSYLLRRHAAGALGRWPLLRSPEVLAAQLNRAFVQTPPFSGSGPSSIEHHFERWQRNGQVEPVDDPAAAHDMARKLEDLYREFSEHESQPLLRRSEPGLE